MKKLLTLVLAIAMIVSLVGCGTPASTTDPTPPADTTPGTDTTPDSATTPDTTPAAGGKIDQIKKAGVIVMGTSPDYPPYEFPIAAEDGSPEIVGIDVSIAKEIAKDLGVELKIEGMDFSGLDAALQTNTIDMILAAYNPTDERKEIMDFSDVYYIDEQCVLVRAGEEGEYTDLTSFNGHKVGVQLGTTQQKNFFPQLEGAEELSLKKIPQLILELMAGSIDGIIMEKPIAESYMKQQEGLAICEIKFEVEEGTAGYSVGVAKGSEDLLEQINATIKRLKDEDLVSKFAVEATDLQSETTLED